MGICEIHGEGRRFAALLCSIGLLQTACYYFSAAVVNGAGSLPVPQPDTLLYCQAAKRICEGFPFSFSAGTAVSTGTTSVLYPFILAIPYFFGFTAEKLLTAGFVLNAFFYFIFLLSWGFTFKRCLPRSYCYFSVLLLALCPLSAFSAFAQSDIGLWMAVSGLAVLGLACEKRFLAFFALMLSPWVRPEGMILIAAVGLVGLCHRRKDYFLLAIAGVVSCLGVFCLNCYLTGKFGFSSVANKGYFTLLPLPLAIMKTSSQVFLMGRELFLGLSSSIPRGLYGIPILGAIAFCLGGCFFNWKTNKLWISVFILAVLGSIVIVAQSGWQGTNLDRYMAWTMPLFVLFSAIGWRWGYDKLKMYNFSKFILLAPIAYSIFSIVTFVSIYNLCCEDAELKARFAREMDRCLPAKSSVGSATGCGSAYFLGDRRVANLGGVYSPEFEAKDISGIVEILKNEPQTRFDYWSFEPDDPFPVAIRELSSEIEIEGPCAIQVKKADWSAFAQGLCEPNVSNLVLKCRLDVGYERDEMRYDFFEQPYYRMPPLNQIIEVATLEGKPAVDTGRLIMGESSMIVDNLEPGKNVMVVIRVIDHVKVTGRDHQGGGFKTEYSFMGPMGLHLSVDGKEVACCHAHIEKKGFSHITLKLPGKFVTSSTHRIGIHGDHPAFCYWFYQ